MPDPFKSHWPPLRPSRSSGRTPTPTVTRPAANRDAATDGTSLQSSTPQRRRDGGDDMRRGENPQDDLRHAHDGEKNAGRRHRQQNSAVKPTAGHGASRLTAARSKTPKTTSRTTLAFTNAATRGPRKAPHTAPTCVETKKPIPRREVRRRRVPKRDSSLRTSHNHLKRKPHHQVKHRNQRPTHP